VFKPCRLLKGVLKLLGLAAGVDHMPELNNNLKEAEDIPSPLTKQGPASAPVLHQNTGV